MATWRIVLDIPEKVLLAAKTDEATFAREVRILAAVKLYELWRLSLGRARNWQACRVSNLCLR